MIGLSDLNAVAEGEADAAIDTNRCMIQQLTPGLWIECRRLLREPTQCADELLRCGLGGDQGGDLPSHLVVLGLDAIVPAGQFITNDEVDYSTSTVEHIQLSRFLLMESLEG